MSCEQLIDKLNQRKEELGKGREHVDVSYFIQYLSISCKEGRPRKTHTSKLANSQSEADLDEVWERTKQRAEAYLNSLQPESERQIVFGQAFYPRDDESQPLHVVTDTSPRYYPESIGAQQVIVEKTKDGEIERLGLSGDIPPENVGQMREIWTLDRIIKASGVTFNGSLPEGIEAILRDNAEKPPRKI